MIYTSLFREGERGKYLCCSIVQKISSPTRWSPLTLAKNESFIYKNYHVSKLHYWLSITPKLTLVRLLLLCSIRKYRNWRSQRLSVFSKGTQLCVWQNSKSHQYLPPDSCFSLPGLSVIASPWKALC